MRADIDQVLGNSLESCKDESKLHQEDAELKISQNGNSLEEVDPVFYMDKKVTVCDLPEIVVCYKESTYNVVKDICVDEGVPVQEKFLFGDKDSVKCSSNSNQCDGSEDKVDDSVKCSSKSDQCGSDDSEICNDLECFGDAEGSSSCNQEMLIVTEEVKEFPSLSLNPFESSKDEEMVISSENFLKGSLTLGDILSKEDEEHSPPEIQEKERELEDKISSQEPYKTCKDSEKPETKNQEQSFLLLDSYEEDNKLFSSGFGFGETSFSAAEPVSISGHITYSGAIAFSGSLSVRSDASTTSTRSFAFPILQSEWNSSPVRMAKAEKRRQKGWRHYSLLCCRFS